MENDEICMKISSVQQITGPSTESIANKIYQIYSMFVSQGSKLNDEQLKKNKFIIRHKFKNII